MSDNLPSAKVLAVMGVAAAAAAVTTVGLYLFLREEDEDQLLYPHVRRVKQNDTSFSLSDRVRVRREVIGNVIGRGGESIKKIQTVTRTRIHFDEDKDGSGDKWATITGTAAAIEEAKDMIERIANEKSVENVFTEEVSVPFHLVGNLIGREGCTIRAMTRSSGAKINVPRNSSQPISGFIPVEVKGSIQQIEEARRQINQIISQGDMRLKNGNGFRDFQFKDDTVPPVRSPPSPKPKSPLDTLESIPSSPPFKEEVWELWTDDEPLREELVPVQEDMLQVYVSHVSSPSRFWVQVFGPKSTMLDKLSDEMTNHYEVNCRKEKVTSIKLGDIVAAPYTTQDETWYRVRIIGIVERHPADETDVRVFYLDFGGDAVHKRRSLCSLKHEFLIALPFQAVECCLHDVQPVISKTEVKQESSSNNDSNANEAKHNGPETQVPKWSDEATTFFSEACHSSEWIEVLARPHEKPSGRSSVPVDLIDFKDKPNGRIDVADLLVSKGFAQKVVKEVNGTGSSSSSSPSSQQNGTNGHVSAESSDSSADTLV